MFKKCILCILIYLQSILILTFIFAGTLVGSIFGSFLLGVFVALILYTVRRSFKKGPNFQRLDNPYAQF